MSALPPEPVPLHTLPDGTIRVVGTRVPLDTVVIRHRQGDTPEAIHASFPAVSLADVYACLAYYHRHRGEVDAYLTRRAEEADAIRAEVERRCPPAEFRARLLARLAAREA